MSAPDFAATSRTTVRRLPQRAVYDRAAVFAILDEALVCHVGFARDGQPSVIPTIFARVEDRLYVHGSAASRMLEALAEGIDVCVTVTLVDGRARPFGLPPFDELSVGGRSGPGPARHGSGREAGRPGGGRGARGPRPVARRTGSERAGAAGHERAPPRSSRGLGQGAHGTARGRPRGHGPAVLGGRDSTAPRGPGSRGRPPTPSRRGAAPDRAELRAP